MTSPTTDEQKAVAYYSAAVTAWFTTSLEHDKSLLTLSSAGIGLLLTLLTTAGLKSAEGLVLYIGAILCFTAALLAVLRVFRLNQNHIEDIISARVSGPDPALGRLDLFAITSFGVGVALTAVIGVSAAIHSFSAKEKSMSDKQQPTSAAPIFDSVNGAALLQPTAPMHKSFNGAASLQPPAIPPMTPVATAQAKPSSVSTQSETQIKPPSSNK